MSAKVQLNNGDVCAIDSADDEGTIWVFHRSIYALIDEYKLLLRKVEDMTDAENEIYEELRDSSNYNPSPLDHVAAINYLRSIHIDCDNLLSTEWAELKTNK